jgi:hypothetical protein
MKSWLVDSPVRIEKFAIHIISVGKNKGRHKMGRPYRIVHCTVVQFLDYLVVNSGRGVEIGRASRLFSILPGPAWRLRAGFQIRPAR